MLYYFPSCNYTKSNPKAALKIRKYLVEIMNVEGCCLYTKTTFTSSDLGLYFCQACREHLEDKLPLKSLWQYLDETSFPLPNYHGQTIYLRDCYRDRNHPEIHQAVRSLLKKMNLHVLEMEDNLELSEYCGTLHYVPKDPQLRELVKDKKISSLPENQQIELMKEHLNNHQNELIVVYCNRCLKGIKLGQGKAVHLMDLIMNETAMFD